MITNGICTLEVIFGLLGYMCSYENLKQVPQLMVARIEFLDLSMNEISEISAYSFARYTTVKALYLDDNKISKIHPNTFAQLTSLVKIDLSGNKITTLPLDLFSLPSLIQLNATDNKLINLHNDLKNLVKPVAAPLQLMDLGNCGLNKVPDFGVLPYLRHLNISWNNLTDMTPQQLSPFCGLKSIELHNSQMKPCRCQMIYAYVEKRSMKHFGISFGLKCNIGSLSFIAALGKCRQPSNWTDDTEDFGLCISHTKNSNWIWILISLIGGLFALLIISYGIYTYFYVPQVLLSRFLIDTNPPII